MHFNTNSNFVDCAIIKVESDDDYYFKVNPNDIVVVEQLITNVFDKYNVSYKRIYLTGFQLVTKNEINTLEKIKNSLLSIANQYITANEDTRVMKR